MTTNRFGLVALALLTDLAQAQDQQAPAAPETGATETKPAAPKEKSGDRVQVTGSRIKRIDVEGSTPVTVIGKEQIEKTGATFSLMNRQLLGRFRN